MTSNNPLGRLTAQDMINIGMGNNGDQQQQRQPRSNDGGGESEKDIHFDLYDPNIPRHIVTINQMSAKDLCTIISTQFKQVFNDYRGCTFRQGSNGGLEFIMVFQNYAPNGNKYKNIRLFNQSAKGDDLASFIEASKMSRNGRKTMTLNDWTRRAMKPYMLLPGPIHNGKVPKIKWEDCLEEKEVNGQMLSYYPTSISETVLVLKNVNVESIIDNIWTPSHIKKADRIEALKKFCMEKRIPFKESADKKDIVIDYENSNGWTEEKIYDQLIVIKSLQNKLMFRGFKIVDLYGSVNYHLTPLQIGPDGRVYQTPIYDLSNFYVNIETVDIREAQKIMPQTAVVNSTGFLSNVY